ncbi:MAG: class I SAM-dependent rRNA methyltransferase [Desulfovibrionaceae bacterium]|jgi:23S rRNA (cytosine1962-C5)-methyltransferase|nr:class I SAM-dependent rRNA methyltransferase [Desulfovibrionaceae bacterium]
MSERLKPLYLKKNEDRRLRTGHLWVFSNEVDTKRTPLTDFAPGEPATVISERNAPVGTAYVNPNSLIAARLVSRHANDPLSADLVRERVRTALALRQPLYPAPFYRLLFGEGDYLPGCVVDRYGDVLVVQLTTAGMERERDTLLGVLREELAPRGVLLRCDAPTRALEGLDGYVEREGDVPDEIALEENGARFAVPLTEGQKTGWFYDQAANRASFLRHVHGGDVLDVFSYVGAVGVQALAAGAASVLCVDASAKALEYARRSADLTAEAVRSSGEFATAEGDAFDAMRELAADGERFSAVSLDPPAFVKRKKDLKQGAQAYRRANRLALDLVDNGGVLMTCSCSQHFTAPDLQGALLAAAREARVRLQILGRCGQGPDHPVHPAMPETYYLKGFLVRVLRDA